MAKRTGLAAGILALAALTAAAGEEYLPMNPGHGYSEIGGTAAVAPMRRATSEDAPAAPLRPRQPLHTNKVTLKIPAPQPPAESRLRLVDVKSSALDGSLDFDLEGAPLLGDHMDIPGMTAPEVLAMDRIHPADTGFSRRTEPRAEAFAGRFSETPAEPVPSFTRAPAEQLPRLPDPEALPPSRRIVLTPEGPELAGAGSAAAPAAAVRTELAPPPGPADAGSLRPPGSAEETLAAMRPQSFPEAAAAPADSADRFFPGGPAAGAAAFLPEPAVMAERNAGLPPPFEPPAQQAVPGAGAVTAFEAPPRDAGGYADFDHRRPAAEITSARPVIHAYEVPLPPRPAEPAVPDSRFRQEAGWQESGRHGSGMLSARASLPAERPARPAPRRAEMPAETPEAVIVPAAGANRRPPRFRKRTARAETAPRGGSAVSELENTLNPVFRQGGH